MTSTPALNRKFLFAIYIAVIVTSVIAAFDIPWASLPVWVGFSTWLAAVGMATFPYIGLYTLLKHSTQFPRFQIVIFLIVVGLPLLLFVAFHTSSKPTGGWEYIIVPWLQLGLQALIALVLKLLNALGSSKLCKPNQI